MIKIKTSCYNNMNISGRITGRLNTGGTGLRVSRRFCADGFPPRPTELVKFESRFHPHGTQFAVPAELRALAATQDNPGCVASGLSALSLLGLPFLAHSCDVTLNSSNGHNQRQWGVVKRRRKSKDPWSVRWCGIEIPVSSPPDAVIEALQDIRDGIHSWRPAPWIAEPVVLWAVQVVDAARRYLSASVDSIRTAGKGRINRRWLSGILKLSSQWADSPKETEMRLICRSLTGELQLLGNAMWQHTAARLASLKLVFSEQVPLFDGPRLITTFDLALVEHKIAIMYDGEHHLAREQRDKDFHISLECQLQGWHVVRVSAGTLERLPGILAQLVGQQ